MDPTALASSSGPGHPGVPAANGTFKRPGYRRDILYPPGVRDREAGT